MIYKASLYKRELRKPQLNCFTRCASIFGIQLILAAASIAVFKLLRLVPENALFAYLPLLLRPGSLPFFYTYNITVFIFFIILFTYKLGKAPLSGLGENKWYLISKMGYNVKLISVFKVLAFLFIDLFAYAAGLILAFIAITLLNLNIDTAFLIPALITGALQMLLLALFASLASLFSDFKGEARAFLFASVLLGELMKLFLGYYKILGDASVARSVKELFIPQHSFYGIFALAAALILLIIALGAAAESSEYYSLKSPNGGLAVVRYRFCETVRVCEDSSRPLPMYAVVFKALMSIVIFISLLLNFIFLLDSIGSTNYLSFSGYVPCIFGNSRMEPEIGKNDLVVIRIIDNQYIINSGDTVFLRESTEGSEFSAMSVLSVNNDVLTLDYLNYTFPNMQNSLKKTVDRDQVYGILRYKSRILGIMINYATSPEGRVLTIVLPLALFLFSKRMFTRRRKYLV